MSKPSFLTQTFGRNYLSIVVVSVLLLITTIFDTAHSQENGAVDREQAFRRIAQSHVQAGKEQHNRGYFEQAVRTLQDAQRHKDYLTVAEREELRALLEKARNSADKKKLALEKFQAADKLIAENQLTEAKASLENLSKNEYLPKDKKLHISILLKQIERHETITMDKSSAQVTADKPEKTNEEVAKTDKQQKGQRPKIVDLYYNSMEYYRAGQYEKAREGFVEVAASDLIPPGMKQTLEGYLAKIDKRLPQKVAEEPVPPRFQNIPDVWMVPTKSFC